MVLDIELTLNRFGFGRPAPNKIQVGPFRFAWWKMSKVAVSFEINWKRRESQIAEGVSGQKTRQA